MREPVTPARTRSVRKSGVRRRWAPAIRLPTCAQSDVRGLQSRIAIIIPMIKAPMGPIADFPMPSVTSTSITRINMITK